MMIQPPDAEAIELLGQLVVAFWVLMGLSGISLVLLTIYAAGLIYERWNPKEN